MKMIARAWRKALEELGWPGLFTLALLAGPMAGYVLIWGVWPFYKRIGFGVMMIFVTLVMGRDRQREARNRERKQERAANARVEALAVVLRLREQGAAVTPEDLRTIMRGLNGGEEGQ